ncbi:pseudouridine synthase pus4 [Thecaphora frezii]
MPTPSSVPAPSTSASAPSTTTATMTAPLVSSAIRAAAASSSSASLTTRPLSGIFGINKPSGPTSMSLLDALKPLFASSPLFAAADGKPALDDKARRRAKYGHKRRGGGVAGAPKLGQGGTLDPLADGVLVIGVGGGTKHLQKYLDCTKEYRTTALLGTATTSYDCCDPILSRAPHTHVTPQRLAHLLPRFTGALLQVPPLYSAVRIDGKRLFEYARENIPLPRPIEARKVRVDELRLVDWLPAGEHGFKEPETEVPEEEKALVGRVRQMAGRENGATDTKKVDDEPVPPPAEGEDATIEVAAPEEPVADAADTTAAQNNAEADADVPPAAFTLEMTVSSGTYVRSIVHDLAMAAGSAAHVQVLTRTRQGEWSIDHPAPNPAADASSSEAQSQQPVIKGNCLPWKVFEDAIQEMRREEREPDFKADRDEQGLRAWERELLRVVVPV